MNQPKRGDVWLAALDPVISHEQGGRRPCIVVSADLFNSGPTGLVVVVPMTSTQRPVPLRVPITPPTGGARVPSDILCEDVRTISMQRLIRLLSQVPSSVMDDISDRLRVLLDL